MAVNGCCTSVHGAGPSAEGPVEVRARLWKLQEGEPCYTAVPGACIWGSVEGRTKRLQGPLLSQVLKGQPAFVRLWQQPMLREGVHTEGGAPQKEAELRIWKILSLPTLKSKKMCFGGNSMWPRDLSKQVGHLNRSPDALPKTMEG